MTPLNLDANAALRDALRRLIRASVQPGVETTVQRRDLELLLSVLASRGPSVARPYVQSEQQ